MNALADAPAEDPARFDVPLYTLAEAARLLKVADSTFSTWAQGYVRRFPDRPDVSAGPIVTATAAGERDAPRVPFVGLAEGQVVAALRRGLGRKSRVSLQQIRAAVDVLRAEIGVEHALASRALYTDGARLLYAYGEAEGGEELSELTELRSGQRVFSDVVRDYLERIDYAESDVWALRLRPPVSDHLIIDPHVGYGRPLIAGYGVPAVAVLDRLRGGDRLEVVADDFGVPPAVVRAVQEALAA